MHIFKYQNFKNSQNNCEKYKLKIHVCHLFKYFLYIFKKQMNIIIRNLYTYVLFFENAKVFGN